MPKLEALLCALVEAAGQEEALKGRAARQMQLWKRADLKTQDSPSSPFLHSHVALPEQ